MDESGLVQKFLGKTFINSVLEDSFLSEETNRLCSVDIQGSLPRRGLEYLKVVERRKPTNEQINDAKIQCLRQLIDIREFGYGELKTKAYVISIEHFDPFFASKFLNRAVDLFFQGQKESNLEEYEEF